MHRQTGRRNFNSVEAGAMLQRRHCNSCVSCATARVPPGLHKAAVHRQIGGPESEPQSRRATPASPALRPPRELLRRRPWWQRAARPRRAGHCKPRQGYGGQGTTPADAEPKGPAARGPRSVAPLKIRPVGGGLHGGQHDSRLHEPNGRIIRRRRVPPAGPCPHFSFTAFAGPDNAGSALLASGRRFLLGLPPLRAAGPPAGDPAPRPGPALGSLQAGTSGGRCGPPGLRGRNRRRGPADIACKTGQRARGGGRGEETRGWSPCTLCQPLCNRPTSCQRMSDVAPRGEGRDPWASFVWLGSGVSPLSTWCRTPPHCTCRIWERNRHKK